MKKILLILFFVPLLFGCGGEKKENDLTENNIKGKVKEIIENWYDAKEAFGDLEKGDLNLKEKSKFNEDGNETEFTSYNSDGELIFKFKYKYDKDGNKTEETWYDKDGELERKYKNKYEFDKENNWIVQTIYEDEKATSITEREIEYY